MPVTPYHLGPGAAFKAVAPRTFSFSLFTFTQVVIDLETLYNVLQKNDVLHRTLHTYAGATGVALLAIFVGRPLCAGLLRLWNRLIGSRGRGLWSVEPDISLKAAVITAFIGTYSHIVFDSMMHLDMRPWAPFSDANALLEIIPVVALHWICLGAGIAGAGWLIRSRERRLPTR